MRLTRMKAEQAERKQLLLKYEQMKKEIISKVDEGEDIQVGFIRSLFWI